MKDEQDRFYLLLFICVIALGFHAWMADDYGYASRNYFTASRYAGSILYIVTVTMLSRLMPGRKTCKIQKYLVIYWLNASMISLISIFSFGEWTSYSGEETLFVLMIAPITVFVTPFLILLPTTQLVLSTVTQLEWMDISDWNIVVNFLFCTIQFGLVCALGCKLRGIHTLSELQSFGKSKWKKFWNWY